MPFGRRPRFSTYILPALYASLIVSLLAFVAFASDVYVGALYSPDLRMLLSLAFTWPLVGIPAALFGLFAIWPVATIAAEATALLVRRTGQRFDWSVWLLSGALIGGPMLFLYSFPLRLGQTMIGPLLSNGILLGIGCAAIVRKFAGPQVLDPFVGSDPEGAHDSV